MKEVKSEAMALDVASERNASQLLEAQMDFKEALAGQLYRKLRIAENLSHQTNAAFEVLQCTSLSLIYTDIYV